MAVSIKKEYIPKIQSAFESLFDKKIESLIIDYYDESSGSMISDDKATNTILKGLYDPASKIIDCPAWASSCKDGME